jgi:hypothetical protein
MRALAAEVRFFVIPRAQSLGNGSKSRTSAAKAAYIRGIYGTAEAVPWSFYISGTKGRYFN